MSLTVPEFRAFMHDVADRALALVPPGERVRALRGLSLDIISALNHPDTPKLDDLAEPDAHAPTLRPPGYGIAKVDMVQRRGKLDER